MAKKAMSAAAGAGDATRAAIAERAYFKAERRGFVPGSELDDWLEAEQELAVPKSAARAKIRRRKAADGAA